MPVLSQDVEQDKQPLFDSAQYMSQGDVRKDTSILSKSIIALSTVVVVLLFGAFTIVDLTWFSLVMMVVLTLSIILLVLVRMYLSRKLENVQLRLEVFRSGIRVNVGLWNIMKNRRRFIPIQRIRRVAFLALTEDAVPKGCVFELWVGKEIFPGWMNEAEMKALKRTMEELMPEKVIWVEHRELRLDDFF